MNREFIHPSLANIPGDRQVALARVAEEASELTKEAMKALRFGLGNRYPVGDPTNAAKIIAELRDVVAALRDAGLVKARPPIEKEWKVRSALDPSEDADAIALGNYLREVYKFVANRLPHDTHFAILIDIPDLTDPDGEGRIGAISTNREHMAELALQWGESIATVPVIREVDESPTESPTPTNESGRSA